MITNPTNGLRVIHELLIRAREQATDSGATELAALLDDLEYLPALMLDSKDNTKRFREYVAGMAQQYKWAHAVEILDSDE